MTAPAMMNGGPPPLPDGTAPVDPMAVTNTLLNAVQQCAFKASIAEGQDAKDFMAAALSGVQAVVVLDPSLSQGGTPLAHDLALEQSRGQTQENIAQINGKTQLAQEALRGENALRQAKETAAAPTPAKKKVATISRDPHGRMSSASVSES